MAEEIPTPHCSSSRPAEHPCRPRLSTAGRDRGVPPRGLGGRRLARSGARPDPFHRPLHRRRRLEPASRRLGDRAWRELLQKHHELVRRQLVRFRGREVDTAGDGFLASFDGPARGSVAHRQSSKASTHSGSRSVRTRHRGVRAAGWEAGRIAVHTGARAPSMPLPARYSSPAPSKTSSPLRPHLP